MENDIKDIQKTLMNNLERLDTAKENISEEVSRNNAISQIAKHIARIQNLQS